MDLRLQGKHALVTGSSKGIREAIARVLILEGAIVTVHGRDREKTKRVWRSKAQIEDLRRRRTRSGCPVFATQIPSL